MFYRKIFLSLSATCLLYLSACGPSASPPKAQLDTPEHHVTNGNKFLQNEKLDPAFFEFYRARELDSKYSPAYTGLGIVEAYRGNFEKGLKTMKIARKYAKNNKQKSSVCVGFMRIFILGAERIDPDWLDLVEDEFNVAKRIEPDFPEPYYYMGLAYKMSLAFSRAAEQFKRVLQLDRDYVVEADKEYVLIQKIERALPDTIYGKKIALLEQLTRADVAALFIEELKIDELYAERSVKKLDLYLKSPNQEFASGQQVAVAPATDIDNHVLKSDIRAVIAIGIKGLQPFPDHTYKPGQEVTRAEYAMMIEDILIKITGIEELATRFIDTKSPFPDLRNDLPYFNAVMTCTRRGIMTPIDFRTGEFDPMGLITGADALLSIRSLKSQL